MNYIDLWVFAALLVLGYVFGRWNERRHFESIRAREQQLGGILIFNERTPPPEGPACECVLVTGGCVVAFDYFKTFAAGLRSLFGGRVTVFESLMDRARREAILRMKQDAKAQGAAMIINVKVESVSLSGEDPGATGAVNVMVYGTALVPRTRQA
jgi:uncharacterized protein YbjQ (UPF0145 family)